MFKIKSQSSFTKIFASLLLVLFLAGSSFSLLHAFSHHDSTSIEKLSDKKNPAPKSAHTAHCLFCFFSNFYNHVALAAQLVCAAVAVYLVLISRENDRVKLSYLFSSYAPRAPPVIS